MACLKKGNKLWVNSTQVGKGHWENKMVCGVGLSQSLVQDGSRNILSLVIVLEWKNQTINDKSCLPWFSSDSQYFLVKGYSRIGSCGINSLFVCVGWNGGLGESWWMMDPFLLNWVRFAQCSRMGRWVGVIWCPLFRFQRQTDRQLVGSVWRDLQPGL